MLTLYVKTGCPYCAAVLHKVEELDISVTEKNIADDGVADELVARGGKRQVPYLVDDEKNVEMYESGDIVEYLEKNYKGGGEHSESEV
jgi:glutaredoxin